MKIKKNFTLQFAIGLLFSFFSVLPMSNACRASLCCDEACGQSVSCTGTSNCSADTTTGTVTCGASTVECTYE